MSGNKTSTFSASELFGDKVISDEMAAKLKGEVFGLGDTAKEMFAADRGLEELKASPTYPAPEGYNRETGVSRVATHSENGQPRYAVMVQDPKTRRDVLVGNNLSSKDSLTLYEKLKYGDGSEFAESEPQRKAAGAALAQKRGEAPAQPGQPSSEMAKGMTEKELAKCAKMSAVSFDADDRDFDFMRQLEIGGSEEVLPEHPTFTIKRFGENDYELRLRRTGTDVLRGTSKDVQAITSQCKPGFTASEMFAEAKTSTITSERITEQQLRERNAMPTSWTVTETQSGWVAENPTEAGGKMVRVYRKDGSLFRELGVSVGFAAGEMFLSESQWERVRDVILNMRKGESFRFGQYLVTCIAGQESRQAAPVVRWTGPKNGQGVAIDFLEAIETKPGKPEQIVGTRSFAASEMFGYLSEGDPEPLATGAKDRRREFVQKHAAAGDLGSGPKARQLLEEFKGEPWADDLLASGAFAAGEMFGDWGTVKVGWKNHPERGQITTDIVDSAPGLPGSGVWHVSKVRHGGAVHRVVFDHAQNEYVFDDRYRAQFPEE